MITSSLCAVHCAALPLLFSFGILGGASSAAHHSMEMGVVVMSLMLGAWSILQAMRTHKSIVPQLMILLGLSVICTGFILSPPQGHMIMALGGGILVTGHWVNRKYLTRSLIQ